MERRIQTIVPAGKRFAPFLTELEDRFMQIRQRAFEHFCKRNPDGGNQLDDWFTAERELFTKPEATLAEQEQALVLTAAVPDYKPEQLEVTVADGFVTVQAKADSKGENESATHRELFLYQPLPAAVDPDQATARLTAGTLTVTMPRAGAAPAQEATHAAAA